MSKLDDHARELLQGAIDVHVHSAPDIVDRKADDIMLVREAARAGMRAVVLKCHAWPTCGRAFLLNRIVPGFRTFGGLALNETVGGLNPRAVAAALEMGCLKIWMPTFSAANHRRHFGRRGGLRPLADNGTGLHETVLAILRLIARHDAVLSTGHFSAEESEAVIEEALRCGVKRLTVNHPEWGVTAMPVEQQKRLAAKGGIFFERCLASTDPCVRGAVPFETIVAQIRAVGVDTTIIATDFGQPHNPLPVEGMRIYIIRLLESGFRREEIRRMVQENPAKLLKLAPWEGADDGPARVAETREGQRWT